MRYSLTEAGLIIERFEEYSISDLDALFNVGTLPVFEEIEGGAAGAVLALNPGNPWWLTFMINILFKGPLGQWTGKKFLTSFNKGQKGYGINVFKRKFLSCLFKFDTYTKNAYYDNNPCLALDYRAHMVLIFNLVDDVRKIEDGIILGQAYYKYSWRSQMSFAGYFVLCALEET